MKCKASQDTQLLQDIAEVLPTYQYLQEEAEMLHRHGIQTYSALYAALRDEQADPHLREAACWVLIRLDKQIDRRRAVPPLLAALNSGPQPLRLAVIYAFGILGSRRALPVLLALVTDRQADEELRATALNCCYLLHEEDVLPHLRPHHL